MYSNDLKTLEDYEILIQEVIAYRELDSQEFDFNGEKLKNTGECGFGSEDAYYKMEIQSLQEAILYGDLDNEPKHKNKRHKHKFNGYHRKMYHKKYKHLNKIRNYAPLYVYNHSNAYDQKYWLNSYVQDKKLKHINNNIIRSIHPGDEDFSLKCGGYRKVYDYWGNIFRKDIDTRLND